MRCKRLFLLSLLFIPTIGSASAGSGDIAASFPLTLSTSGIIGLLALFVCVSAITWFVARRQNRREHLVMDKLPLRYFVADTQGKILLYALGNNPESFHGKLRTLNDLPDQKVNRIMATQMPEVLKTGKPTAVEFEFNHQRRTALISPLPPGIFSHPAAIWISQDTTALLQARDTAEASAARLKLTLDSIGDGVLVTDSREIVTMVNPVATRLLGMSEAQLCGRKLSDVFRIVDEQGAAIEPSPVTACIASGQVAYLAQNADLISQNGDRYHIADSAAPIRQNGETHGAVLVFRDITAERNHREQLHESEMQIKMIMENFPAYIVVKDIDNDLAYVSCSQYFADMQKRPREEIIGHRDCDFFSNPKELGLLRQNDLEAIKQGKPTEHVMPFTDANGGKRIGHFRRTPMRLSNNRNWLYVVADDITDLFTAKTQTEELAERLSLTLRSIGDGVLTTDPEGNITMLNPVAEQMMGCSLAEALGKPHTDWFKIVGALDQWPTPSPLLRSLRTGDVVEMANHTDLLSANGARYHIADSSAPIRNRAGKIIGGILIFRDVTEDYEQRYALRNLNTLLTSITDNLPAEFFLKDVENDFRYLQVNWGLPELLQLPPEKVIGRNDFDLFPAEHAGRLRSDDIAAIQSDRLEESKVCYQRDENSIFHYHFYRKVITNADGKRLLLGVVVNCTEQEQQKLELEKQKIELARYNEKLQQFIQQDEVLNWCFEELLVNDDFGTVFRKLADIIGTQLHAATVLIDRYREGDPACFEALECWQPPGTAAVFRYDRIVESDFPAMFGHLKSGGFIHFSDDARDATDLTPWQTELCGYFKESGMREIICVPLMHNRRLWGYLGAEVHAAQQSFKSVGERMMSSAAHMIEVLLQREELRQIQRREEEEKLMILNVMPIPVVLLSSDYLVLQANAAALRMVGGNLEDYAGHTCFSTICHRKKLDENCPAWLTLHTGKPQSTERRINDRIYLVNTMPLWRDGELKRVLKVYIDITDITHTRELLQEAVDKAEAAAQAKSQFLATMSHEIRTPLNAVVGFSELLQDTEMSESERREYLHSINLAGNALLNLINDILDLSKIEAKQMPLSLRPGNLAILIQEMQAIFQHRLADKNLIFEVTGVESVPFLMLDYQRLRQVLLNLIGNAIKFTHTGKITVETCFERLNDAEGTLQIIVKDTGIGIGEAYRQRIFEPFVQEETTRDTHNQTGTGLGLAIVKRLIENMGGQIELTSSINQGSCFAITLSAQICPDEKNALVPAIANGLRASSARILIVDDVAMNLKVLGAMLNKIGCEFESTTSPMQAMTLLEQKNFDMVLTDLWMPEMNGAELARKIKADYPGLAVYATTADVDGKDSFDMRTFDGVITKPISLHKLQELFTEKSE